MNMGDAAVFEHWNHIARAIGGLNEDSAVTQDVGTVLAFLALVEICCNVADQQPSAQLELQQRLKSLLSTRHALHWAPLVVHVFKALPGIEPAIGPANSTRLNTLLTQTHTVKPLLRWHAGMICALHLWLGFRLLVKAPKFLRQGAPNRKRGMERTLRGPSMPAAGYSARPKAGFGVTVRQGAAKRRPCSRTVGKNEREVGERTGPSGQPVSLQTTKLKVDAETG